MGRSPAPDRRPVTLAIAGSDSGGGAGIQADLRAMEAVGAFGTTAVTAVTAQHTRGVESSYVLPTEEIRAQLDAVLSDFDVRAAKTGMLATAPVIELVTDFGPDLDPLVVDPVMVAASGDPLLEPAAEDAYEDLLREATLTTPNADEAAVLTGVNVVDTETAVAAGESLLDTGVDAALVKGGHVSADPVQDVLVTEEDVRTFEHPRIDTDATHGSGCTLASTIAAHLARGEALPEAVEAGVAFMERAVRYHLDIGRGPGAVHHLVGLRERAGRQPTQEAVIEVVDRLVRADVRPLVPEVGMNVVGASTYAESSAETAAIEGRLTRTRSGIARGEGVRFGASSHVARFLLAAREHDPSLRFALNCRFDDTVEAALERLDWSVVELDRTTEPAPDTEGRTMKWAAARSTEAADGIPAAVFDRGAVGKEPMTRVVAPDAGTLGDRIEALLDALE
jgi:hydroxymethylpyrimidine/phosphomethylpyrimidine kinase